jgi:hypothetical protein
VIDEPSPIAPNETSASSDERHQPMGAFIPGLIASGYHVDLRGKAGQYETPERAAAWLELLAARRARVMPVTVLQLGLGAWQRGIDPTEPSGERREWADVAQLVASWAAVDLDGHGRFVHHQPMPHTYAIEAGWSSAMAQALGVSLLVRHDMADDADRAIASLIDPSSELIFMTEDGPILEEYPAEPRPHVLNGWMWSLYGLYDYAHTTAQVDEQQRSAAADMFERSAACLAAQLDEYETGRGWTTYDRYPHAMANIASPFYHRLHIDMLGALARVAPHPRFADAAARWQAALDRPTTKAAAVARKVGFRIIKPRRKAA